MKIMKGIGIILLLLILVLGIVLWKGIHTTPKQVVPEGGVWYCEELQTQLSFDLATPSWTVINEQKVLCQVGNDRGSKDIMISCGEFDNRDYYTGELLFVYKHIRLEETRWFVQDDSGQEYVFVKQ